MRNRVIKPYPSSASINTARPTLMLSEMTMRLLSSLSRTRKYSPKPRLIKIPSMTTMIRIFSIMSGVSAPSPFQESGTLA